MKKLLVSTLALLTLTSCSFNKQIFDTTYSYDRVYFYETNQTFEIKSWTDYEDGDVPTVTDSSSGYIVVPQA